VKLGIGLTGVWVLGMSAMFACSGTEQSSAESSNVATMVAALSVNSDGSDATWSDPADPEPAHVQGCGFEHIASKLAEHADVAADAASGAAKDHGDGRAALLVRLYDADGNGTLDDSELSTLKADIEARCEARFAKLLAEFDSNADGALDATEWAAAEAALHARFEQHHREHMQKLDTDGDGELADAELEGARADAERHREGAEHAFDRDGDGTLGGDESERFREQGRQCVREDRPMMSDAADADEPAEVADPADDPADPALNTDAPDSSDDAADTEAAG